jgi:hypothetical protein
LYIADLRKKKIIYKIDSKESNPQGFVIDGIFDSNASIGNNFNPSTGSSSFIPLIDPKALYLSSYQ